MASTYLGEAGGAGGIGGGSGAEPSARHAPVETPRAIRLFLLKALLFAAVWGALFFRGEWLRYGYWLGGWAALVAAGLLFPAPFRPLRRAAIRLGAFLGQALSWLALAGIYWLAMVPISLAARLAGKRFLDKGKDAQADSYWIPRAAAGDSPEGKDAWERQF